MTTTTFLGSDLALRGRRSILYLAAIGFGCLFSLFDPQLGRADPTVLNSTGNPGYGTYADNDTFLDNHGLIGFNGSNKLVTYITFDLSDVDAPVDGAQISFQIGISNLAEQEQMIVHLVTTPVAVLEAGNGSFDGLRGGPILGSDFIGPEKVTPFVFDLNMTGLDELEIAQGGEITFAVQLSTVGTTTSTTGFSQSGTKLLLMLAVPEATQPNHVDNGSFDTNVQGWTEDFNATADHDSFDIDDSASSGSALVSNKPGQAGAYGITQCIATVVPGASYDFSVWTYVPASQPDFTGIQHRIWFLDTPDCSFGNTLLFHQENINSVGVGAWLERDELDLLAPAGTGSVFVRLMIFKNAEAPTPVVAYFDDVVLAPEPSVGLLQGAALGAVGFLARRRSYRCDWTSGSSVVS